MTARMDLGTQFWEVQQWQQEIQYSGDGIHTWKISFRSTGTKDLASKSNLFMTKL